MPITVVIKFSDGNIPDYTIERENVHELTISGIRQEIRSKVGGITINRRLRLIHGGKVLSDQSDLARELAGTVTIHDDGRITHEVQPNVKVFVHCAVGDILTGQELKHEEEFDNRVPTRNTLPELRGFDQLRSTGFTEDDIVQLRQQFGRIHGYGGVSNSDSITERGEVDADGDANGAIDPEGGPANRDFPPSDELRRMEEQWIESVATDNVGDAMGAGGLGGDYFDDLLGILMGMFLGVFVLLILREPEVLSRRQQRTLVSGAALNVVFAFLRRLN